MLEQIYLLPVVALLAKFWILFSTRKYGAKSELFIVLILAFCALNVTDCTNLLAFQHKVYGEWSMRAYFVISIWCLVLIFAYSSNISHIKFFTKLNYIWCVSALVLSLLVIFTDTILSGVRPLAYTYAAEPSAGYTMYLIYVIFTCLSVFGVLITSYLRAEDTKSKVHGLHTLVALTPIVLAATLIMVLMRLEFEVNATGIIPVATTLFLFVLRTEAKHLVTDMRRHLPFSDEKKMSKELQRLASLHSMDEISYKELKQNIERVVISYKYKKHKGSARKTADSCDMDKSTLYSILKRHGLRD